MAEHAYSQNLTAPAEKVGASNAELSAFAARDFAGVQIGVGLWDQWTAAEKNRYGTMEVRRTGDPVMRPAPYQSQTWQMVASENAVVVIETDMSRYYDIAQTWADRPIAECQDIARQDAERWLAEWTSSQFSHENKTYDTNPAQEGRLSFTDCGARIDGDTFTASWFTNTGEKVTFPNQVTWNAFVKSGLAHVQTGNTAYETLRSDIDQAADTAALNTAFAKLPAISGAVSTRATGPLPGGQADPSKTEPVVRRA